MMMQNPHKKILQFEPRWNQKEKEAVMKVLDGNYLNEHKTVREFERRFAEFVGAKYCVTTTSGTMALYMALTAADIRDKQIFVPDYAGIFAANASKQAGKMPVLADVSRNGSRLMVDAQTARVTVHSNGRLGEPDIVEDCCQAIGHHTKGCVSCYSFASTKHLTTLGQGGAACCDDEETYDRLCRLKDHGRNDRQKLKPMSDNFEFWGTNLKFTEAQAAFGLVQLDKLPQRLERLGEMYSTVKELLAGVKGVDFLDGMPTWYLDVLVPNPQRLVDSMAQNNVQLRRFYRPLHQQKLYLDAGNEGRYSNSTYLYNHGVWLPSTTDLADEEIGYICEKVKEALVDA
jgi:perosamine synthetase